MTSIAVRPAATASKNVSATVRQSIMLRQQLIGTNAILAVGVAAIRLGLRHVVTGGAGTVNAIGVAKQSIMLRPAGGLRNVSAVVSQSISLRPLLDARKALSGVVRSSVLVWPVEFGQKGTSAAPRSSIAAALQAIGSGALTAFGVARQVLSLATFGTHAKALSAAPMTSVAMRASSAASKASGADPVISIPLRSFVVATAIATTFGAARVSLSLSQLLGAEKTVLGRALAQIGLRIDANALKRIEADQLTSIAIEQVVYGISGAPSRVVREIRGCKGLFDLSFAKRGSAQNK